MRRGLLLVQELVHELLEAFVAEERATHHQQRRDGPGRERADREGGRHEDDLVDHRALGDAPDHRQFAIRIHTGHLLRIQGEVVAEHAGGLLRRDLRQNGDIVEDRGDVVDQCEQAASGQVSPRLPLRSRKLNACR